ncbi:DUF317 domain-containing protein [Streptomyces sp. NPDC026589]|uniref:DUF317 domain-containing protein n=1 Tax=Streptomyces TaxID=1883 RepID=UPI0033F6E3C5|nr:DUF317 domain-containing protein [Streptomyces anulatus]
MTPTAPDAQVRLDTHPTHDSAVVATVTGPEAQELVAALEADAWHVIAKDTLVLVRIDREEPYWAQKAAHRLTSDGITVHISPRLVEAMDEEWTWAAYPMPWCTRAEIREVSDQAQQIYDAIRHGRLRIHAHAHDGYTTVAVGTYPDGESVHLHGEDHLRVESYTYGSAEGARDEALAEFLRLYGDAVRLGPAHLTDTEREADQTREPLPARPATAPVRLVSVPVYAADPADPAAVLDRFLAGNSSWKKHKHHEWPGEATYALHESLVLRVELYHHHDAGPRDQIWTVAAYESPVGDRLWHATATAGTPEGVIMTLLKSLDDEHDWGSTTWAASTAPPDHKAVLPLADYSWKERTTESGPAWTSPDERCRLQRDRHATWTASGGTEPDRPAWTMQLSQRTPPEVIQQIVFELAEGQGPRRPGTPRAPHSPALGPAPAVGPPTAGSHALTPRGR